MYAKVTSAALLGIDALSLEVEVDISSAIPSFTIVGLPDASVSESKERVRASIVNSKFSFPYRKITVNLAPADMKKEGSSLDLPIAIGLLSASGQIENEVLRKFLIIGELALDGIIRPVNGILSVVAMMKKEKIKKIILPYENADEAALMEEIEVYPAKNLKNAVEIIQGGELYSPYKTKKRSDLSPEYPLDFSEVKGQEAVKRAITISAAGNHNILMIGPPGSGKTMIAKRVPTILPPLTQEEAMEVTRLYSIAGKLPPDKALITQRPFRSPHHSASKPGLVGGGVYPRPGEVSLAHRGVLFLDEFPEFNRSVLEVLRQPIEDGNVTISRANQTLTFPASFMLVASMNPCPCGFFSDPTKECSCSYAQIQRYRGKISGPLMDRIDIHIDVPPLKYDEMINSDDTNSSCKIRTKVEISRQIQLERFKRKKIYSNADMNPRDIKKYCKIPKDAKMLIKSAIDKIGLSARAIDKILKLARTIADIEEAKSIKLEHVAEAIQYRSLDR